MIRRRRSVFGVLIGAVALMPLTATAASPAGAVARGLPAAFSPAAFSPARASALRSNLQRLTAGTGRFAERDGTGALSFAGGSPDEPLRPPTGDDSSATARQFIDDYGPAFGVAAPSADLTESRSFHSGSGDAVRYQQSYRGVPVIGGELAVQLAPSGAVVSTSGKAAVGLSVGVTPKVLRAAAIAAARAVTAKNDSVDPASLIVDPPVLSIFDPSLWGITDPAGQRLVWRTAVHTASGLVNRYVLIDATTGKSALDFTQVEAALNRQVCDRMNIAINPNASPNCVAPVRSEGQLPSSNADVDSAYDMAGLTYNFYLNVLGRDSVDGLGLPLKSTVRVCINNNSVTPPRICPYSYGNAFWDGFTEQMYYGAGFANGADVVGHELTHGVTQFTSQLTYHGQSGAINESISDVFGELIDRSRPTGADTTWALGEDLPIGAIRNMQNPPSFGDPDRMGSPLYYTGSGDNGGVHTNSGVNNKAAYLIDAGDTFNGHTITGLGDVKTAWIYYLAQTTLLTSLSQFSDLGRILPQACVNLIGQHGIVADDCTQVLKAMWATEMEPPYASLVPARLMETRSGYTTVDDQFNGIGVRTPGSVTALTVAGRGGVPIDASSVTLNVTVVEAQGSGYLTVYPCGVPMPVASNLNYVAGSTVPNMVTVKIGDGGQVCIYAHATTDVLVDVGGYFPAGAALTPVGPARLVESRPNGFTVDGQQNGIGLRPAGSTTEVQVTGRAGIPADATAVMLNVTVTEPQAEGFVTVYPCGGVFPTASNLNYVAGATIPNAVLAKIGAGGKVCVFTQSATQLLVDVGGWFPAISDLVPLDPARLMESRPNLLTVDGQFNGIGLRGAGQVTELQVTGRGGVPANATAVALNVTVTETQASGFVTVFPCGAALPTASNLNYDVGTIIPNAVIVQVGIGGKVCFYTHTPTQIVADVNGYFTG